MSSNTNSKVFVFFFVVNPHRGLFFNLWLTPESTWMTCRFQVRYSIKTTISQKPVTRRLTWGLHISYFYQTTKLKVWNTIITYSGWAECIWSFVVLVYIFMLLLKCSQFLSGQFLCPWLDSQTERICNYQREVTGHC